MTQDQHGQARDSGYVRGDVVTDDETEEFPASQAKPITRFQKVASAVRGNASDQAGTHEAGTDEADRPATGQDEIVAVTSPDVPVTDTAADPLTRPDEVAGQARRNETADQARPDAEDHSMTQPDMFGATARPGTGYTSAPYQNSLGPAGAATFSDVPATEAPGVAGRHATARADAELRPGEASGMLGDLSDIAYGNLIPDAAEFRSRWQQIQFRFVDDPHGSVTEAADVIAQVTARLEAAIQERQRAIEERQRAIQEQQRSLRSRWGEGANADTETLRETLRMYRGFLDQLIGPKV
jgi:hypothetical protein